jgi:hypothetical protein
MTYHLYIKPDGYADVTEHKLGEGAIPDGYTYFGEVADRAAFASKRYVDGKWGWGGGGAPEFVWQRDHAFPNHMELFRALWRAMDGGMLPKIPGFYDVIKEVNERFPPT